MSLVVKVFINSKPIAEAVARNVSNLDRMSNYECQSCELAGPFSEETELAFQIDDHMREQTCWALVERIATEICRKTPYRKPASPKASP